MPSPPPRFRTELIRWEFVERSSRKGYMTRDFNVGGHWYKWLSSHVSKEGIVRHGMLITEERI